MTRNSVLSPRRSEPEPAHGWDESDPTDETRYEMVRKITSSVHRHRGASKRARSQKPIQGPILIRRSEVADRPSLERLAALDGYRLPGGSFLVAELHGELVAAAPLDVEAEPFSDPFLPLADIRDWLGRQAARNPRAVPLGARAAA